MRFVDDDRVVPGEQPVALQLGQQEAVGDQPDRGVGAGLVVEPHGIADLGAEARPRTRRRCAWPPNVPRYAGLGCGRSTGGPA
ncbi:hypothetical protein [Aeromicrobium sp. UC242_57]|uniref:hypothetical protein n=1 Tax=Aeromicrobium sp. UC242_57 TaxID=3374624 RepID=UPI003795EB10